MTFDKTTQKRPCENCGEPIPVARLEALPYATMRKECAEALES